MSIDSKCLYIPVRNSDEMVEVSVDDLPDEEDIIDILKAELAPLDIWLNFAVIGKPP